MATNKALSPTPPANQFFDKNVVSASWYAWFDDLSRLVGFRNTQIVEGEQSLNLDSKYVDLRIGSDDFNLTLDPPTIGGVQKLISVSIANGGTVSLNLDNVVGTGNPTVAEFATIYDSLKLEAIYGKWLITAYHGVSFS